MNGVQGGGVNLDAPAVLREAAEKGDARSQARLGKIYLQGLGVVRDYKLALAWFLKAAEQGNGEALAHLGQMHEKGLGVDPDIAQALACYKKSFAQGNTLGQVLLGDLYLNGSGVDQSYRKALACYLASAEKVQDPEGASLALLRMGVMHCQGRGVEKDLRRGFELYLRAAKLGNGEAQRCVGAMYRDGLGVERDHKKALAWLQKAAKDDQIPADSAIGDIYRDGLVVEKNILEAIRWYGKAAAKGDKYAKAELLKLQKAASPPRIEEPQPAPAGQGDAPVPADAAPGKRAGTGAEKGVERSRERNRNAVESMERSAPVAPRPARLPIAAKLADEKTAEIKTSPQAAPGPIGQTRKALVPRPLLVLFSALAVIGLALVIVWFGSRKNADEISGSEMPEAAGIAAPLVPGPLAVPAVPHALLATLSETPKKIPAGNPSSPPSRKAPLPAVEGQQAARTVEAVAPRLRREYRSLAEVEISEMLTAKNLFDAARNPGGNFQHRFESRNVGGLSLIIDRSTQLVWTRQQNLIKMNLDKTVSWIESLNQVQFGGIKGWRLPTVEEAASLLQKDTGAGGHFLEAVFGADLKVVWTGDRFLEFGSWVVDFQNGTIKNAKNKSRQMTLMVSSDPAPSDE